MNVLAGDATVDQMYELNLVRTPADFYDLRLGQLLMLDGWKEKSATRFLDSLGASRQVPFERVLYAIGIRHVGEQTAKDIARHFGSMDRVAEATREQLLDIPEVGEVIADSVYGYFREERHRAEIRRLAEAGLRMAVETDGDAGSDALAGKTIVISGNFSISREEMKALVERHGGRNSGSVSGKTDFLLAGEKPGPEKLKKAASLGVPVIDEAAFMAMLPADDQVVPPSASDMQLSLF